MLLIKYSVGLSFQFLFCIILQRNAAVMSALSRSKQYCISLTSNAQSFYQNVTASNRSTWFEGVTTNAPTSFIRNLGYI